MATDGSNAARAAVEFAVEIARGTGAWATLACVRREPPPGAEPADRRSALRSELSRARGAIEEAATRASAAGVEVESEILSGDPVEKLADLAEARSVDLIVVGTSRGRREGELGGVAGRLVARAACPVLVVKPLERRPRPLAPRRGTPRGRG